MATREEYIDKLENQLREWNKQIDAYQAKAEGKSKQLKTNFETKSKDLKQKRADLQKKLDKIKESGEDTFDDLKKDAEKLWDDIKVGFAEVKSIIKN